MSANDSGSLDLIAGPMYSGKTTELLRRLFNEAEVGMRVLYVNHSLDNRSEEPYSTHNPLYKERLSDRSSVTMKTASYLKEVEVDDFDVIGIDEAQFFEDLECVVDWVDNLRKHVIVSGLNGDAKRSSFGKILSLEPYSDTYTKLQSYCKICAEQKKRSLAPFTHKFSGSGEQTDVGAGDKYIPVCRSCYLKCHQDETGL